MKTIKDFLTALFYDLNMLWIHALLWLNCRRDIRGLENVPRKGAFILACNHLNNADPPLLTEATPRRIAWMAKMEWFSTPVVGGLFRLAGMVPVRRFEADLQALRKAQGVLKTGHALGMFPEGTRSRTGQLGQGEPGSALIALRSGAPVVPVAIWGTEKVKLPRDVLRRNHATISFGRPFTLPRPGRITKEDVLAGTETIMRHIAALLPPEYRGTYADAAAPPVTAAAEGEN